MIARESELGTLKVHCETSTALETGQARSGGIGAGINEGGLGHKVARSGSCEPALIGDRAKRLRANNVFISKEEPGCYGMGKYESTSSSPTLLGRGYKTADGFDLSKDKCQTSDAVALANSSTSSYPIRFAVSNSAEIARRGAPAGGHEQMRENSLTKALILPHTRSVSPPPKHSATVTVLEKLRAREGKFDHARNPQTKHFEEHFGRTMASSSPSHPLVTFPAATGSWDSNYS